MKIESPKLEARIGSPFCLPGRYKVDGVYIDLSDLEFTFTIYDGDLTTDPQLVSLTTGGPLKDSVVGITPQTVVPAANISADFDGSGTVIATGAGFTSASVGDILKLNGGPYDGTYPITEIVDDNTVRVATTFATATLAGTAEVHLLGGILVKFDTSALAPNACASWLFVETTTGNEIGSGRFELHNRVIA